MQLYSHTLSLSIVHPSLDPASVTQVLGLKPQRTWLAGEQRSTPKGTPLQGRYAEGYWATDPFEYGWQASTDMQIEDALEELVSFLEPHAAFLRQISSGGIVKVWVSSQSTRNYAFELSPSMLGRLASLGATLVHDVYPGP
jgi:hypothetical protein